MCGSNAYSSGDCKGGSSTPKVTIGTGDVINGSVYGLFFTLNADGDAKEASVQMTGGEVTKNVYGAKHTGSKSMQAYRNQVSISGGTVKGTVFGSHSGGHAHRNQVDIEGAETETGNVVGGQSVLRAASENKVTIAGDAKTGTVTGGLTTTWDQCKNIPYNDEANEVIIAGKARTSEVRGGSCNGNKVTIEDAPVIEGDVSGAKRPMNETGVHAGSQKWYPNIVTVRGGTVNGSVYGGTADYANYNQVTIEGGTVEGDVKGSESRQPTEGSSVTIAGGTVKGIVYGGYSTEGSATQNTVTISGGVVAGVVYGGDGGNTRADHVTGNTLNVKGQVQLKGAYNFAAINFTLPDGIGADETVLDNSGIRDYEVNLTGVTITVNNPPKLGAGSSITLISKVKGTLKTPNLPGGYVAKVEGGALIIELPTLPPPPLAYTINTTPVEGGSISCEPDWVEHGTDVAFTCTATKDGHELSDLKLEGGNDATDYCRPTGQCYAANVQSVLTVTASFVPKKYIVNVTAAPAEGGTVDCGGVTEVEHGKPVSCTITRNTGWKLGDLSELSLPTGVTCTPISETAVKCETASAAGDIDVTIPFVKDDSGSSTGGGSTGGGSTGGSGSGTGTGGSDDAGNGGGGGGDNGNGADTGNGGGGDSSSPTMGELGLLLSGLALAGAAAPALRRREKQGKKADTRQ